MTPVIPITGISLYQIIPNAVNLFSQFFPIVEISQFPLFHNNGILLSQIYPYHGILLSLNYPNTGILLPQHQQSTNIIVHCHYLLTEAKSDNSAHTPALCTIGLMDLAIVIYNLLVAK